MQVSPQGLWVNLAQWMQTQYRRYNGDAILKAHLADPILCVFVFWWGQPRNTKRNPGLHWAGDREKAAAIGGFGKWFKARIVGADPQAGLFKVSCVHTGPCESWLVPGVVL